MEGGSFMSACSAEERLILGGWNFTQKDPPSLAIQDVIAQKLFEATQMVTGVRSSIVIAQCDK